MVSFIIFIFIVVGLWMLLRYLRTREIQAFRDADMSVFEDFTARREERLIDPLAVKAQALAAKNAAKNAAKMIKNNSSIATLPAVDHSLPVQPIYTLKKGVFDEAHRSFYEDLQEVTGSRYRVLIDVPLGEFVQVEESSAQVLEGKRISTLLCEKKGMVIACGIQLEGAGAEFKQQFEFLQSLFLQIGKPLFDFPPVNNISKTEIRARLRDVLLEPTVARNCAKCGKEMLKRKAVKGKNTGKSFWVCTEFPGCNSVVRIGKFP